MIEDALALVVEDDFDASVIFAKALEVLGFKTEVIATGDKAVERIKEVVPEIIVLDLHLPEVMGTAILRRIRSDERLKDTLVILATADPRSADLVQDMADLVLLKPTTFSQVRDLASRLTASRRKPIAAPEEKKVEEEKPAAALVVDKPIEPAAPVAEKPTEPAALVAEKPTEPAALVAEKPAEPDKPGEKKEEKPEPPTAGPDQTA